MKRIWLLLVFLASFGLAQTVPSAAVEKDYLFTVENTTMVDAY